MTNSRTKGYIQHHLQLKEAEIIVHGGKSREIRWGMQGKGEGCREWKVMISTEVRGLI
jgi:hypothetical protein